MVSDRYPRRDGGRRQTHASFSSNMNGTQPFEDDKLSKQSQPESESRVIATSRRSTRGRRGDDNHNNSGTVSESSPPNDENHARSRRRSYSPHFNGVSPKDEPVRRSSRRGHPTNNADKNEEDLPNREGRRVKVCTVALAVTLHCIAAQ